MVNGGHPTCPPCATQLKHPYLPISFERIMERSDSVFLFRSKINGMELKGQMTYLQMPTGPPGGMFAGFACGFGMVGSSTALQP